MNCRHYTLSSALALAVLPVVTPVHADDPAGEIGYYFLRPYSTAPLRFPVDDRAESVEAALEKKCPGAKLLTMAPTNSGGYHSSDSFVISFIMPAPGCPESR